MTWSWFPFLVGAPLWGSLAVLLFGTLLTKRSDFGDAAAARQSPAEPPQATASAPSTSLAPRPARADAVVSLETYRFRKAYGVGQAH